MNSNSNDIFKALLISSRFRFEDSIMEIQINENPLSQPINGQFGKSTPMTLIQNTGNELHTDLIRTESQTVEEYALKLGWFHYNPSSKSL